MRFLTVDSHVNGSPSTVHPAEHLHSALYLVPLVTSSTVLSGSYHSSISLSPYSPFSSHQSPSVMPSLYCALTGARGLVEPLALNNGDAAPGVRASAPGRRIGGAGATHIAAMTAMALERSPNPDGGVDRVSLCGHE